MTIPSIATCMLVHFVNETVNLYLESLKLNIRQKTMCVFCSDRFKALKIFCIAQNFVALDIWELNI